MWEIIPWRFDSSHPHSFFMGIAYAMIRTATLTFLVLSFVGGLGASASAQRFDSDEHREARELGWMFNYDEAVALARKTNRPLMVVFRCVP